MSKKQRMIVLSNIVFTLEVNRTHLRTVNIFTTKMCTDCGLGFETRYVLLSKLKEQQSPYINNLLPVDNREVTTVLDKTVYPEDYLINDMCMVRDLFCRGTIDPVRVNELNKL